MAVVGGERGWKTQTTAFSKDSAWVPIPDVTKKLAILKVEAYF